MNKIENSLSHFKAITLEGLEIIKLLKRYDTKFVFHKDRLMPVFDYLSMHYQILEIDNRRLFRYENLYYDTNDHFFYHQHHNKKYDRYKVRCRRYADTDQCYFEIKHKNNKKKTIKNRLLLVGNNNSQNFSEELKEFAKNCILIKHREIIDNIRPKLGIEFDRATFANLVNKERLTIDFNLAFNNTNSVWKKTDNLVIAELKSEKLTLNTDLFQYLKGIKIYPFRISKYCIGMAMTEKNIKYNRFKKKLLKLKALN